MIANQKPNVSKLVEVEDENGQTVMGVVERLGERGEIVVRILATDRILTFKPVTDIRG